MVWTDERMDDFATRVDAGFERVDRDMRDLETRMDAGFTRVDNEFRDVRTEMNVRFERVDNDIRDLHREVRGFGIALMVGLVGVIAALMGAIATGALAG